MDTEMTPDRAAADLARAELATGRIRDESRSTLRFLVMIATGFAAVTLLSGLLSPLWLRLTVMGVLLLSLVVGALVFAARRRAAPQGRRASVAIFATGILYGIAYSTGSPEQIGNIGYWLPAAVVVALPTLVAAGLEARR